MQKTPRCLSNIMVKYPYSLPSSLEQLRLVRIFAKLDLRSCYNLAYIHKGDKWKTAFSTTSGHYQHRVMPYGLACTPSVFQCFINDVLRDFLGKFVITYIDDIFTYSPSKGTYISHVSSIPERLMENQLYVKGENCKNASMVTFLGYIISDEGVAIDGGKQKAVKKWPILHTVRELHRFLVFANYYQRFIRGFSMIAAPLMSLLKGITEKLKSTTEVKRAFQRLKLAFTSAPIFQHPDPEKPFMVEVDTSDTGVRAMLLQSFGETQRMHPIACFPRNSYPQNEIMMLVSKSS